MLSKFEDRHIRSDFGDGVVGGGFGNAWDIRGQRD